MIIEGWPGGNYASPSMGGSRSGGLIAATWASMLHLGKSGYRAIAADVFRTADEIKAAVRSHPELTLIGDSLFNVAFRATPGGGAIDIFHVNDALTQRGWRMNGLQNPPALHFCVTKPNTQPGVTEAFAVDLAAAIEYAKDPPSAMPRSGATYGAGGVSPDVDQMRSAIIDRLDAIHEIGPR